MKNYKEIKRTNNLPKFNPGLDDIKFTPGNFGGNITDPNPYTGPVGFLGMSLDQMKLAINPNYNNNTMLPKHMLFDKTPKTNNSATGANIVGSAVLFAGATINSFGNNQTSQDVLNNSGLTSKNAMGIAYNYQYNPDENKEWSNLRKLNWSNGLATAGSGAALGAAVGSIIPGLGTVAGGVIGGAVGAITGLFGAKHRANKLRRAINNARLTAEARNTYNYAGAATQGMQNEYYQENGDTDNGILYANKGKDLPKYNKGRDLIKCDPGLDKYNPGSSPFVKVGKNTKIWAPGDYAGAFANAMVGLGESLVDFENKDANLVTKGKGVGIDDQYAKVNKNTFIAGNDIRWSDGKTFAEVAQPYTIVVMDLNKGLKLTLKNIDKSSLAADTIEYMEKKKDGYMNNLQAVADEQKGQHEYEQKYNTMMANRGRDLMKCVRGLNPFDDPYLKYTNYVNSRYYMGTPVFSNVETTKNPNVENTVVMNKTPKNKIKNSPIMEDVEEKTENTSKNYLVNPWLQRKAHLTAALGGVGLIIDSGQESHVPRIYSSNPYDQFAWNTLAKNKPNPYNQLRAIDDSERRALYGIRGLSANQRMQAGIAAILGAGANRAGIYSNTEDKMNQYRTALANLASTQGQQDRVARMEASKYMEQALRDTAAAKYKMKNTGWQNINNAIEQSYADDFKLNMAQKQLGLYNQELSAKQQELINNYNIAMANIAAMKGDNKTRDYIMGGGSILQPSLKNNTSVLNPLEYNSWKQYLNALNNSK